MQETSKTTNPKVLMGKVISTKMNKTVVVLVERFVKHPKYGKIIKRCSKMHVHDDKQVCEMGNMVKIQETRPISKTKSWKLLEVIS